MYFEHVASKNNNHNLDNYEEQFSSLNDSY